jgi:hypothetical protein
MKKSSAVIAALAIALVVSNGWWLFKVFDAGVSATYMQASFDSTATALHQLQAVTAAVLNDKRSKEVLVPIAQKAGRGGASFEKEGVVWVDSIGMRFNSKGAIVEVVQE